MVQTSRATTAANATKTPFGATLDEQQQARLLAASEQYLTAKRLVMSAAVAGARDGELEEHRLRRLALLQGRLEVAQRNYDRTLAELGFPARHPG